MSRRKPDPRLTAAFGKVIRALREENGFKQEDFAYRCNLDRASYGRMERGAQAPNMATVWQVAEGLGTRPQDLIAAVEKELAADQELEAEKGAQESTAFSAVKKTPKHLGYAGQSRDVAESTEDG